MIALNLPTYSFKIKSDLQRKLIFDEFRKKYVVLTPEEWVRQNFMKFLVAEKSYPISLTAVEKKVDVNGLSQRFDAVVFNRKGQPSVIIEFKAPSVKISQEVFDQIARYNMSLKVDFLIVSNGLKHYCCKMDYEKNTYYFLKDIPDFSEIISIVS